MEAQKIKKLQFDDTPYEKLEAGILCVHCAHIITFPKFITPVFEKVEHQFINPMGNTFTIHCFKEAPGCVNTGLPSLEFTWFKNHSWQMSHCKNCEQQMGWYFSGAQNFYGLIVNQLVYPNI